MEIVIRKAEIKDVQRIMDIVNYEILNSTALYDYEPKSYDQQLRWFEQKQIDCLPLLVADDGDQAVGFGTYGIFRPWAAYKFSVEHSIYIDKDSRGCGIGELLLTKLIEQAKENGIHVMIAGVDGSNQKSFEFHKKFGFEEIGTFKEVGYKFDKWLDLRFLQLILE